MFSEKMSLLLSLVCCAVSGAAIAILRILSAPLWLLISGLILFVLLLCLAAARLYAGSGRYQEHVPETAPCKEYPLCVSALCFLLAALFRAPQLLQDAMLLSLILIITPLLAAMACGLRFLRGEGHPTSGPLALLPIFYLCVHLLNFYRSNSNHPDTASFGYEIVVHSLLLLGLYLTASSKYKLRHPVFQRIWAMLPLAGVFMELVTLLFAPGLLRQASNMNAATFLTITGAGMLLITPLTAPIQPVSLPEDPAQPDAAVPEDTGPADAADPGTPCAPADAAEIPDVPADAASMRDLP